jgi:hypothetical protein
MVLCCKPRLAGTVVNGRTDCRNIQLSIRTARRTDKKLAIVKVVGMGAANVSIQRCDAMNQSQFKQKIEGTVNRWRGSPTVTLQFFEQIVSSDRFVMTPHQLKNSPPQYCKALASPLT